MYLDFQHNEQQLFYSATMGYNHAYFSIAQIFSMNTNLLTMQI